MSIESKLVKILNQVTGNNVITDYPREDDLLTRPLSDVLVQEFGADSLDEVELVMAIEEEFDTEIEDSLCKSWQTLQQVADWLGGRETEDAEGNTHIQRDKEALPAAWDAVELMGTGGTPQKTVVETHPKEIQVEVKLPYPVPGNDPVTDAVLRHPNMTIGVDLAKPGSERSVTTVFSTEDGGPDEEDGPWADGWNDRSNATVAKTPPPPQVREDGEEEEDEDEDTTPAQMVKVTYEDLDISFRNKWSLKAFTSGKASPAIIRRMHLPRGHAGRAGRNIPVVCIAGKVAINGRLLKPHQMRALVKGDYLECQQGVGLPFELDVEMEGLRTDENHPLFGVKAEKARADQLGKNCNWFVSMFDRCHRALGLPPAGGYQRTVEAVVAHLEAHAEGLVVDVMSLSQVAQQAVEEVIGRPLVEALLDHAKKYQASTTPVKTFESELSALINKYSMEGKGGDTPDYMLAEYLRQQLTVFDEVVRRRDEWYGHTTA